MHRSDGGAEGDGMGDAVDGALKAADDGSALPQSSSPTVIARMLRALDVHLGPRVLRVANSRIVYRLTYAAVI